jgi:hypothetical protein
VPLALELGVDVVGGPNVDRGAIDDVADRRR